MSRFSEYIRNIFKRSSEKPNNSKPTGIRYGDPAPWLYSTTPALCVGAAYRCINLLSSSVANLPVVCKRRSGNIFRTDLSGSLPNLLNVEPDTSTNAFDFWRQVIIEVLCAGNAYIVPYYSDITRDWIRLALCSRGAVTHNTSADSYTISDFENGIYGVYDESQVIHIKGMPGPVQKSGVSVLTHARLTMNIASAGERETLERFDTGGGVTGLLSIKNDGRSGNPFLQNNEESAYDAARIFNKQKQEMDIVALPGEYDFRQFSMSSVDMQFLESRKFTVREICRFFGVHPSFVFDDTSNNYKSAEMANVAFLSNTLNPLLRQIENELLRKLFPSSLWQKRKIEFDRQGLYACDLDSKVKYIGAMIGAGLYTVNEARALEDREPVEGGDKVFISANLKSIDEMTGQTAVTNNENGEENNNND